MKPVFWPAIVFAAALFAGCGLVDGPHATPTPRSATATPVKARFTAAEARSIIRENGGSCGPDIAFDQRGMWVCPAWTLDEVTGAVFRTPR